MVAAARLPLLNRAGPRIARLMLFRLWHFRRWAPGPQGAAGEPVSAAIRTALGHLQLDVPLAQSALSSAFFRNRDAEAAFVVPTLAKYVQELHACWTDTRAFSRPTADGRALAAMHEVPKFGLGCMPPVESAITSLIVPPDEALRPNARCPRPQCRVTDNLLCSQVKFIYIVLFSNKALKAL
ncbi:hypothetical protein CRENBAI_021923 [Crenichthys baileyi]|uniref:Uncharacterized protein n=1 Tax=Crenichthys baileyi TaxID=28760 RepID=A0AAV9QR26_9TELE